MTTPRTSNDGRPREGHGPTRPALPWWAPLLPAAAFALLLALLVNGPSPGAEERPGVTALLDAVAGWPADPP